MGQLSNELQIGKAGQHYACYDLIKQGYNAFLSDEGLLYDVLVDHENTFYRIQVKTTTALRSCGKTINRYCFGTRRAKGNRARPDDNSVDVYAFVAMVEKPLVAYFDIDSMVSERTGGIKQLIQLKTREIEYASNHYKYSKKMIHNGGMYIEDYTDFGAIITWNKIRRKKIQVVS
jgi:hypothetical protein